MHRRKEYLIYPPNYVPGGGYKKRFSVLQAKKLCLKMGCGAGIDVHIHIHPGPFKSWVSSFSEPSKGYAYEPKDK